MRILVTGACGYIGSVLVPKLLAKGHKVLAFDTMWFGNHLESHANLQTMQGDIRHLSYIDADTIIHLAAVANDPCGDLDPKLTWEINCLGTMRLADAAMRSGVKQFIYASSGSVYGVNDAPQVTEGLPLNPISEYNKTKMCAERILLSYVDEMAVTIVRPATVCGYSPRMRLDVSVNMLTMQALTKGRITVFGGKQIRPNIHIEDMTDLYVYLLGHPFLGVYNAGFENLSIMDIAKTVVTYVPSDIVVSESNDPRSYRLCSDKLLATGFKPEWNVEIAIVNIVDLYKAGKLKDGDSMYNLKWMQQQGVT